MAEYQTFEHDVLIIGAGGAGLRAAIEASAAGVKVGVVTKSLLGKAHTVMAEGGMAAAMGNVDDRDNWRVHFADTMRGGQYLNNPRMAELHAKEAPDRVRELEAWGAVFDRTKDGRILQRNFGGHRYPRLAHVGDRTGLEMIRTLQDHGIHQGIDFHMECTILTLLKRWRPRGRRILLRPRARTLPALSRQGRGARHRRHRPRFQNHQQQLGVHRRRPLARLSRRRDADGHGVRAIPSHRNDLAAQRARHSGHRRRARRRRRPASTIEGKRFMFDDIPANYKTQTADNPEEGWRYTQGDKSARRPPELLTRDHVARCIMREVREGRGSPHGGVFLDIAWIKEKIPNAAEHIKKKLPSMYHQFKQLGDIDITKEPMEIGPTTHYMMGGVRVDGDTQMSDVPGLFAAGECGAGLHGANRLGGNSLSDLLVFGQRAGEYAAKFAKQHTPADIDMAQVDSTARQSLEPFERTGESPYQVQHDLQDLMQDKVGIVRLEAEMQQALDGILKLRERAKHVAVTGNREYNPGWHTALDLPNLLTVSEAITRAALLRKESRGAHFRDDYPAKDETYGSFNLIVRQGKDGEMTVTREPLPPLSDELKKVIEEMK